MTRLRFPRMAMACLIGLLATAAAWSAPAPAARSGLDQIPATAPIVIHLRGAQGTRDRFVTMMEKALPDVLKMFQTHMDDALKDGIKGRKLRGLVKDGPIFLAFTELPKPGTPGNSPPFAILAAVSNYKEFRDNLLTEAERKDIKINGNGVEAVKIENETTYFVDRKTYAIVTPNEEVANSFTKKQPGLDGKLSKEQAAKLMASDVGVYISVDTLSREYAEQIKEARQALEGLLDMGAAGGEKAQKDAIEMFKRAIGPVFQAVQDSQGVLMTIEFRPGGLALHVQSEIRGGSPTADLLLDSKPVAFKDLARMPDGRGFYTALKTSSALYKGLGSMMVSLIPTKQSKETAAALEEMAKAGPGIRMDSYSLPLAGLQVYHYDDPAKAIEAQIKMFKAMYSEDKSAGLKEKPVIKLKAEKYGEMELHSVQFVWDFDKMAEPAAAKGGEEGKKKFIEAMKGMLGEKMTVWFGTDGKSVVQVTAADWPTARKLLDQYTKGGKTIGDAKAFADVRKEMPAQASFLGLIDVVQMFGTMAELFKPLMGANVPPNWPKMPDKGTRSFLGLSVTLQPQRGSFDLFISAAAAQEFYKAFVQPALGQ
jgi:hypothetical protein